MSNFEKLLELTKKLRGPNGCPWDRSQTFESLIKDFHEEADELSEAIKNKDMDNLEEELGDVCFSLALIMQIGMDEKLFTPKSIFERICKKIIARHTWVFGDDKVETAEEALELWKKNKKKLKEKSKPEGEQPQ
jgi:tetrapyrrole methylase family protein/MazG family protein